MTTPLAFDQIQMLDWVVTKGGDFHVVQGRDDRGPFKYGGYFGRRHFTPDELAGAFRDFRAAFALAREIRA